MVFGNILDKSLPNSGGLNNFICKPPHSNMLLILIFISGHLRLFVRLGQFCVELHSEIVLGEVTALFYWLFRDFAGNCVIIRPPKQ